MTTPALFLSHARADAHLVIDVRLAARAAGLRLSTDFARQSEPVAVALAQLIAECAIFAVLLTPGSMHRPWVRWEVTHALRIGKPVAPIADDPGLLLPPPFDRLPRVTHLPLRPAGLLAARLAERLVTALAAGEGALNR
ncbi:toll/interleukin-1 receptor domain-containing protein [Pseudosporangium ferrugineum]|uniref:TIR domain-containing protein n=1 Tax=Pseudosporangium ferrugineum TaxID=439699 RepID=A0A2T0RBX2_9ACTN|nr:toll/interleukin-1 receptor domain-containing protein [Pseudosporangium ferrugineum]PRY18674.1 TIR domain-containing protein [Pseudosporangium ferrugineum]